MEVTGGDLDEAEVSTAADGPVVVRPALALANCPLSAPDRPAAEA